MSLENSSFLNHLLKVTTEIDVELNSLTEELAKPKMCITGNASLALCNLNEKVASTLTSASQLEETLKIVCGTYEREVENINIQIKSMTVALDNIEGNLEQYGYKTYHVKMAESSVNEQVEDEQTNSTEQVESTEQNKEQISNASSKYEATLLFQPNDQLIKTPRSPIMKSKLSNRSDSVPLNPIITPKTVFNEEITRNVFPSQTMSSIVKNNIAQFELNTPEEPTITTTFINFAKPIPKMEIAELDQKQEKKTTPTLGNLFVSTPTYKKFTETLIKTPEEPKFTSVQLKFGLDNSQGTPETPEYNLDIPKLDLDQSTAPESPELATVWQDAQQDISENTKFN